METSGRSTTVSRRDLASDIYRHFVRKPLVAKGLGLVTYDGGVL